MVFPINWEVVACVVFVFIDEMTANVLVVYQVSRHLCLPNVLEIDTAPHAVLIFVIVFVSNASHGKSIRWSEHLGVLLIKDVTGLRYFHVPCLYDSSLEHLCG